MNPDSGGAHYGYQPPAPAPKTRHISPAIRELGVERVVDAAKNLRALELNGHFETPAWWQEMGRLRDAVDDLSTLDRALTKRGA